MINIMTVIAFFVNATLTITSSNFTENGMIPSKYTCEGENTSPALHIADLPAEAKSLAIIMHDPDAPMKGGFTHWVAWNIDPTADISENFNGGVEGMNGAKKAGYTGPCPPNGTHHYHFMVFALDTKLTLDKSSNKDQLEKAMQGHIISKGEMVGLYRKVK